MRGFSVALALGLAGLTLASPVAGQADGGEPAEAAAATPPTAEQIIEVARERLRPPGVRRPCKLPENNNEIVVCARDPDEMRVESPTDEALRTGAPGKDSIPRAPDVFGIPPCEAYAFCSKMGGTPEPPLIVDLTHMPTPLSQEDAALVYRVEDGPPRPPPAAPAPQP
jgi:hypothetical protein